MAAYRRVYDSRHPQADCREPGSAPKPYARQSRLGYLYLSGQVHVRTLHTRVGGVHNDRCPSSARQDCRRLGLDDR